MVIWLLFHMLRALNARLGACRKPPSEGMAHWGIGEHGFETPPVTARLGNGERPNSHLCHRRTADVSPRPGKTSGRTCAVGLSSAAPTPHPHAHCLACGTQSPRFLPRRASSGRAHILKLNQLSSGSFWDPYAGNLWQGKKGEKASIPEPPVTKQKAQYGPDGQREDPAPIAQARSVLRFRRAGRSAPIPPQRGVPRVTCSESPASREASVEAELRRESEKRKGKPKGRE